MIRRVLALIAASSSLTLAACAHEHVPPDTSGFTYAEPRMTAVPDRGKFARLEAHSRARRAPGVTQPPLDPAEPPPAPRGESLNRTGVDEIRSETTQD